MRHYNDHLKKISESLEQVKEEERIRIAREVHDQMGQLLTVLKMDVTLLSKQMREKVSGATLNYFDKEATKIIDRINTIMESVQHITTELRPEVLENLGLVKAIQWQAREYKKRVDLRINFKNEFRSIDFLDNDQSTALFRIYQETMTNILRHAKATKVNIVLRRKEDYLFFMVSDNGIGITDEQQEAPTSLGIIGMRERSRFLGGDITIEGIENEGTRIVLQLPLKEESRITTNNIMIK